MLVPCARWASGHTTTTSKGLAVVQHKRTDGRCEHGSFSKVWCSGCREDEQRKKDERLQKVTEEAARIEAEQAKKNEAMRKAIDSILQQGNTANGWWNGQVDINTPTTNTTNINFGWDQWVAGRFRYINTDKLANGTIPYMVPADGQTYTIKLRLKVD